MRKEQGIPNFIANEEEVLKFWEDNQIFNKLKAKNKKTGKYYTLLDGPITANYNMGLHHAFARTFKDATIKYRALKGYDQHYQNGFDAHGLPVEVGVEKELGINSKKEIEEYGIANFVDACLNRVNKYSNLITQSSIRLGQWMNWEDSYYTNSDNNITAIWHFLKQCSLKNMIGQKYRPMPWCTRCGTSLSEHEMSDADAYKNDDCLAVFIKLPLKEIDAKILVWTTTPWTLSSNVAIAVNPELNYSFCQVKSDSSPIIVCESAIKVLKDDIVKIIKTVKGSELVGYSYETCFEELPQQQFTHKIVAWEAVDSNEGCGAVHIAPGCGAEDFDLGLSLGLEQIIPIDEAGNFYDDFGFLSGLNANKDETRDLIFNQLKDRNKLYYYHNYTHRYPHCWRCKSPLLFRLIREWVIKVDDIRPKLIEQADTVEWNPEFLGKRMKDWLTNMGDWSISRPRYYGLPLPFYPCKHCGKTTVVGSIEELKSLAVDVEKVNNIPHLHRPYIDEIKIKCPHCQNIVERIKDVGDCWLDAGIVPFSTKKYFTDKDFWQKNFPADAVIEGKEQVRLWFYSMLLMSVVLTGKTPFKKAMGTPMLLAQDGKKLSKSSPNNIPLDTVFNEIGADLVRYNFVNTPLISDVKFGYETIDEVRRKILNLWNSYLFYNTYASIDEPDLTGYNLSIESLSVSDKWLIVRTNQFVKNCDIAYDKNEFGQVTSEFEKFIDEVSNWYIRINRRRFWKGDNGIDKLNAYFSLNYAIKNIAIVLAPITPFLSEYLWQHLIRELDKNAEESVMLASFGENLINIEDENLINQTNLIRDIITLTQRLRNEKQIKVKQPLKTLYICGEEKIKIAVDLYETILKDELNIKNIVIEQNQNKFNYEYLMIDLRKAGSVLKGDVQKVKNELSNCNDDVMKTYVAGFHSGNVNICGYNLDSNLFILQTKAKPDYVIANIDGITVVLDITIDKDLLLEGLSRELIRACQVMRKNANFDVADRIIVDFDTNSEDLLEVLNKYADKIKAELLATEITHLDNFDTEEKTEIAEDQILIRMKKV